jgi:hypothetical protein
MSKATLILLRQRAFGLVAKPTPRQLHNHATDVRIARARNALVVFGLAALIGLWHQADQRSQFSTVPNAAPTEDFCGQYPGARWTDGPHGQQRQSTARCWRQIRRLRQSQGPYVANLSINVLQLVPGAGQSLV